MRSLMFAVLCLSACAPPSVACDSEGKPFEERTNCRLDALEHVTVPSLLMQLADKQAQIDALKSAGKVLHLIDIGSIDAGKTEDLGIFHSDNTSFYEPASDLVNFSATAIIMFPDTANCTGVSYALLNPQRTLTVSPLGRLIKRSSSKILEFTPASYMTYDFPGKTPKCLADSKNIEHPVEYSDVGIAVVPRHPSVLRAEPR